VVTRYESDKNYPAPFVQVENLGQVRVASHRGEAKSVERVASPPQIRAYRVNRARGVAYIVWAEDGVLQLPSERELTTEYALTVTGAKKMRVRLAAVDATTIEESTRDVANGAVVLTLTSRPVLVEPVS